MFLMPAPSGFCGNANNQTLSLPWPRDVDVDQVSPLREGTLLSAVIQQYEISGLCVMRSSATMKGVLFVALVRRVMMTGQTGRSLMRSVTTMTDIHGPRLVLYLQMPVTRQVTGFRQLVTGPTWPEKEQPGPCGYCLYQWPIYVSMASR
mgnify:CR=1 FL=1